MDQSSMILKFSKEKVINLFGGTNMSNEIKQDDAKIKSLEVEFTRDNYVSPGVTIFAEHFLDKTTNQNQEVDKSISDKFNDFFDKENSERESIEEEIIQTKLFIAKLLKKYYFTHDISETDKDGYYNVIYSIGSVEDYEEVYKDIVEFNQNDSDIKATGFSYNGEEISFVIDSEKKDINITCRFNRNGKKYQILKDDFIKVHKFKSCIPPEEETSIIEIKLYRIQALKTFTKPGGCNPVVHVGELGGYIESEDNLSQYGNCWLFDEARVKDDGKVLDDAIVYGKCIVSRNSVVRGRSIIGGHCFVTNQSVIIDSTLEGNVIVNGHSVIHSGVYLYGEIGVDQSDIGNSVNLIGRISVKKSRITAPFELSGDYELNFDVDTPHSVIGYNTGIPRDRLSTIRNIVASKIEDKWSANDFKGTGEELIEYFSRNDPECIGYYCNLVEFHKKQYNL